MIERPPLGGDSGRLNLFGQPESGNTMIDEITERCNVSSCGCEDECELKNRIVDEALDLWCQTGNLELARAMCEIYTRDWPEFRAA